MASPGLKSSFMLYILVLSSFWAPATSHFESYSKKYDLSGMEVSISNNTIRESCINIKFDHEFESLPSIAFASFYSYSLGPSVVDFGVSIHDVTHKDAQACITAYPDATLNSIGLTVFASTMRKY
jgi:hypothetical protein